MKRFVLTLLENAFYSIRPNETRSRPALHRDRSHFGPPRNATGDCYARQVRWFEAIPRLSDRFFLPTRVANALRDRLMVDGILSATNTAPHSEEPPG